MVTSNTAHPWLAVTVTSRLAASMAVMPQHGAAIERDGLAGGTATMAVNGAN